MIKPRTIKRILTLIVLTVTLLPAMAQPGGTQWSSDGNSYFRVEQNEIVQYTLPTNTKKVLVTKQNLTPSGQPMPLQVENYIFSPDEKKILLYTNSVRVWRINTRGDYWLLNLSDNSLKKLGSMRPPSSLMFAKFSPDGKKVAYVSEYNVYVEDLASGEIKPLTSNGSRKLINGTFDWVYEEEFACRDGIRWSNDSKSIAYWQIDASTTRDFYMINNTDSVYSHIIPVEYPKVGQRPSACRIGVVDITTATTTWMNVPGDPRQHYIVRMEFIPGTTEILIQQLNRKQNESKIIRCHASTGTTHIISTETDKAWIDVYTPAGTEGSYNVDFKHNIDWIAGGKEFLWISEKDGWNHL
jgi:dipeptidyl-peptidase 4